MSPTEAPTRHDYDEFEQFDENTHRRDDDDDEFSADDDDEQTQEEFNRAPVHINDDDDDDDDGRRPVPRPSDRCARLKCSKARVCVPDRGETDADGDGIPCREDCDDTDPTKGHFIYCARAGTANDPNRFNRDNDSCIDCGAPVDRVCAAACPATFNATLHNGTVVNIPFFAVNQSQLCETPQAHTRDFRRFHERLELHVCFGCDCCATNPAGCDMPSTCGINRDADAFPLCGTVQPACVLQEMRNTTRRNTTVTDDDDNGSDDDDDDEHSRGRFGTRYDDDRDFFDNFDEDADENTRYAFDYDSRFNASVRNATRANRTALADQQCVQWAVQNNLDTPNDFVFIPAPEVGHCENCEEIKGVQELSNQICQLDTDGDGHVQCPFDKTFAACCATILRFNATNPNVIVEPTVLAAAPTRTPITPAAPARPTGRPSWSTSATAPRRTFRRRAATSTSARSTTTASCSSTARPTAMATAPPTARTSSRSARASRTTPSARAAPTARTVSRSSSSTSPTGRTSSPTRSATATTRTASTRPG